MPRRNKREWREVRKDRRSLTEKDPYLNEFTGAIPVVPVLPPKRKR